MQYDQLPLPLDAQMLHQQWLEMGYAILHCPGCEAGVSYPANTNMYAVVCKCGYFTEVDANNCIWWYPPCVVRAAVKQRQVDTNSQN